MGVGLKQTCMSCAADSQVDAGSGKILHPQSSTKEGSMHVSAGDCSLALGQVAGQRRHSLGFSPSYRSWCSEQNRQNL